MEGGWKNLTPKLKRRGRMLRTPTPHSTLHTRYLPSSSARNGTVAKLFISGFPTRKGNFIATAGQFGRLDRRHLLLPRDRSALSAHRADLIAAETRDADVVLAFEDELDVSDFEAGGAAELGELAGAGNEVVDKVIGGIEEDLRDH